MTFEEFFKKKRIDLDALEKGNPALFFEFKTHFNQMGEKSFDHTKKYWFNNLRKLYHLAAEIKTEKPKIENQLAEQTVTDTLNESAEPAAAPKLGFTPKFRAGATKPAEETPVEEKKEDTTAAPKPGFTPRFKAAMAKPAEASTSEENKAEETSAPTALKPGFTPRFKAGVTKPVEAAPEAPKEEAPPVEDKPKIGFTPRFKAGVTKPVEAAPEAPKEEAAPLVEDKPKIGFTPRFKAVVTKPAETAPAAEEKKEEEAPAPAPPKLGFKPKFKPTTPPKPEGE
ncbi:MAG: hypothetical protein EOP47_15400 [Sphingobacteriaceae bacterium]|nr:MAG: hypothetical protein EOP47_15400 [Sphingobacteriaceae bacterium]